MEGDCVELSPEKDSSHSSGARERRIETGQSSRTWEDSMASLPSLNMKDIPEGDDHAESDKPLNDAETKRVDQELKDEEDEDQEGESSVEERSDDEETEAMALLERETERNTEDVLRTECAPDRRDDFIAIDLERQRSKALVHEELLRTHRKRRRKPLLRRLRMLCGRIVDDSKVQMIIIALIIINAIVMGIATFDFVTDNPKVDRAFRIVDETFLVIFTLEISLQLMYRSHTFFQDGWLVFDLIIVVISWSLESLQIIRALRIFRAFRLITRLGALRELVMAIAAVMPRIYAIAMLLILIFYIFAVLFTQLFQDLVLSDNYFGSLDASLFTCMELMTLEWAGITREVMDQRPWAWLPLLSFISITGFIVFNLIVAVVCDAVALVDRQVKAEKNGEIETEADIRAKLAAQERIWDLTDQVNTMRERHEELYNVVFLLAEELRTDVNRSQSPATDEIVNVGEESQRSLLAAEEDAE